MTALDAPPTPATSEAAPQPRRTHRAVIWQLAGVEARRFTRHPVVWVGVVLGTWLFVGDLIALRLVLPRESIHIQIVALPIGAAASFVAHLATTRPRRDGVTEVLEPAVHGDDTRVLALLLATLAPAALTACLVAVALAAIASFGAPGPVLWAEAATAPAVVAAAWVLGVLLGRVAPWRLAPLFPVVAIWVVQFAVLAPGAMAVGVDELLGPLVLPAMGLPDASALVRPAGLHLLYVLGVAGVLAVIAALVGQVNRRRIVVLVATLMVAAGAGVAQLAPPSDEEVDALLARVGTPVDAGECTADGTGATVCALPMYLDWRDGWAEVVRTVRQPLIDRGVDPGPVTVAQRSDPAQASYDLSRWFDALDVDDDPRMQTAWEVEFLDEPGTVLVTAEWPRGSGDADPARLDLALHVARQSTGLPGGFRFVVDSPADPFESSRPCQAGGQAREPLTLWLAARTDPAAAGALREAAADASYPGLADDLSDAASGMEHSRGTVDLWTRAVAGGSPEWSQLGVHLALQLLDQPDGEILDAVVTDWDRWTDRDTSVRELVDELGLTMPPLADDLRDQLGDDAVPADLAAGLRDTPLPPADVDAEGVAAYDDDAAYEAAPTGCP